MTVELSINCFGAKRVRLTNFEEQQGSIYSTVEIIEDEFGDRNEEVALVL